MEECETRTFFSNTCHLSQLGLNHGYCFLYQKQEFYFLTFCSIKYYNSLWILDICKQSPCWLQKDWYIPFPLLSWSFFLYLYLAYTETGWFSSTFLLGFLIMDTRCFQSSLLLYLVHNSNIYKPKNYPRFCLLYFFSTIGLCPICVFDKGYSEKTIRCMTVAIKK